MYFFLNYDCFDSSSSLKSKSNLLNQARKENDLRNLILKSAKHCANKFDNESTQEDKESFSKYCSKKLQIILNLPELDIFNKMFYDKHEDDDHKEIKH